MPIDPSQVEGQPFGLSLLSLPNAQALADQVGVTRSSQIVYYSTDNLTPSVDFPAWAQRYRFRFVGKGGGAGSGASALTTTLASGGGAGGCGGFYVDIEGQVSELKALWANPLIPQPLVISFGADGVGGAGVISTGALVNGTTGTKGGDTTLTTNGVIIARASGGSPGNGGTAAGGASQSNAALFGGVAGANGGAGTTNSVAAIGLTSNTADTCAGGVGGSGFSTANATANGRPGALGGLVSRIPSEAVGAVGGDANLSISRGLPFPGNSGGGGASNGNGRGGNGSHGGGGSGSAASRSTSLKGGDGIRAYAIIEWFGAEPVTGLFTARVPLELTASRSLVLSDSGKHLFNNSASVFNIDIPNSVFTVGDELELACPNTGTLTITPLSGVTLNGGAIALTVNTGKGSFLKCYSPASFYLYGGI